MRTVYFFVLFLFILIIPAGAQVGIGTTTPSTSSILELNSLSKALLLPRMNQAQINAIASPVAGMIVFCTNCSASNGCVQIYEDNGWHCINDQKIWFLTCNVYSVYYEVYFGGRVWLDRNLGAKTIPQDDQDVLGYGSLYQWGRRGTNLHHCVNWTVTPAVLSGTTTTQVPSTSNSSLFVLTHTDWNSTPDGTLWTVGAAQDNTPCPSGYRVPTEGELTSSFAQSGANITEMALSPLHWVPAGFRNWNTGDLTNSGTNGYYWSKEAGVTDPNKSVYGHFSNTAIDGLETNRSQGMSVRCIKQ